MVNDALKKIQSHESDQSLLSSVISTLIVDAVHKSTFRNMLEQASHIICKWIVQPWNGCCTCEPLESIYKAPVHFNTYICMPAQCHCLMPHVSEFDTHLMLPMSVVRGTHSWNSASIVLDFFCPVYSHACPVVFELRRYHSTHIDKYILLLSKLHKQRSI